MSTAERIVEERNRDLRMKTAKNGTLESQITNHERWAVDVEKVIKDRRAELIEEGRLTEKAITEEIDTLISNFETEAGKRIDKVKEKLEGFDATFELPEQDQIVTITLAQNYARLTGDDRMTALREAVTGRDTEMALALLRGPKSLTKIDNRTRATLERHFMKEADQIKKERLVDLEHRATSVLNTFEATRRRLRR